MVRAGLVRQVGAGLWTWLPAGWRVHQNVVQIVREEMDAIGGQEMLMPVLNPAELWQRSGRYAIDELFKLQDRRGRRARAGDDPRGDRHLPRRPGRALLPRPAAQLLYHFQTKERDEPRPRAGVLRTREFIMKDAYSFDRDARGPRRALREATASAYDRIFDRVGLEWYRVESDVGMMGGTGAHEYMAPCPAGENDVALAPGYAANVEVASAEPQPVELPAGLAAPEQVHTPGTDDDRSGRRARSACPRARCSRRSRSIIDERGLVLVVVRGDHRVNEIKLRNALGRRSARRARTRSRSAIGPAGFIGPVGADVPILLDDAVAPGGYVAGANRADAHLRGVEPGRDFPFERVDVRTRRGRRHGRRRTPIRIEPAIEVGNIFKLGTRYSEPLGATYLDEGGKRAARSGWAPTASARRASPPPRSSSSPTSRASPGRGRSRRGTSTSSGSARRARPSASSPSGSTPSCARPASTSSTTTATPGPGEKFADAELLGVPLRLTVGRRSLEAGELEAQVRRGREQRSVAARGRRARRWRSCGASAPVEPRARLTFRRLSGLDRSGPPPPETLPGAPLRPWTIPNAIGYVRLALIPVFLVLALCVATTAPTRCRRSLRGRRLERLRRRHRRARHRPVQRPGRAARPGRRPRCW